jgi:hypothetical protein
VGARGWTENSLPGILDYSILFIAAAMGLQ